MEKKKKKDMNVFFLHANRFEGAKSDMGPRWGYRFKGK